MSLYYIFLPNQTALKFKLLFYQRPCLKFNSRGGQNGY
nr:MAG TPA: hypothetical protein [Caudoviricetes sp.]